MWRSPDMRSFRQEHVCPWVCHACASQKQRPCEGLEHQLSVLIRLPGEMRRGGWSHCQGGQARYPLCRARFSHPTLEGHGSCRAPSLWDPPRTHVSLLVSDTDTDPPFLQCGGCRHWIRHCYRQTKGQVELHKSILDTNSCKYLFLCFLK